MFSLTVRVTAIGNWSYGMVALNTAFAMTVRGKAPKS